MVEHESFNLDQLAFTWLIIEIEVRCDSCWQREIDDDWMIDMSGPAPRNSPETRYYSQPLDPPPIRTPPYWLTRRISAAAVSRPPLCRSPSLPPRCVLAYNNSTTQNSTLLWSLAALPVFTLLYFNLRWACCVDERDVGYISRERGGQTLKISFGSQLGIIQVEVVLQPVRQLIYNSGIEMPNIHYLIDTYF